LASSWDEGARSRASAPPAPGESNRDAERARPKAPSPGLLRVGGPAAHALPRPVRRRFGRGPVDLPQDVAAHQAHLILQLPHARVAGVVLGAQRADRTDVLGARGCDVQVFTDAPPMRTENIGPVSALCA